MDIDNKIDAQELFWKFAPYNKDGNEYDADTISDRMAEWSIYFFKERHIKSGDVPGFHRDIYKDMASDFKYIVITAPSGFSKTTICTLIYPLYRNVYYREPYTIICTRTGESAIELFDEIKHELRYNEEFKRVYGALLPFADESESKRRKKKDSARIIELENSTAIACMQIGGQIRGRKRGGFRVTLFILDDPEEVQDLDSDTILKKNMRWLDRSAEPRLDKDYGKMRVLGTLIGHNCTVGKLMKRNRWVRREYKALIPQKGDENKDIPLEDMVSIWEKRWPTKELQEELKQFKSEGRFADFLWERQNEPPTFLQKDLSGYQFYRGEFERWRDQNILHVEGLIAPIPVYTYHAIDPAFSQAESADERAQVTFAVGWMPTAVSRKPFVAVIEYDFDHKDPSEIIERALNLHRKYFYRELYVETVGGQKIYEYLGFKQLQADKFLLNHPLTPVFINYQGRNKLDRIYQMFSNYNKLKQFYIHPDHKEIQEELDLFMNASHLHLLDALEMGMKYAIPCDDELVKQVDYRKENKEKIDKSLEHELEEHGKSFLLY